MTERLAGSGVRQFMIGLFRAAVAAADPATVVPGNLPAPPAGRTVLAGAGKASASMARAFESEWKGALSGIVLAPHEHGLPCEKIEVLEAGHPYPDSAGMAGAQRILETAERLGSDDLLVALISGGGSSLLALPAPGLSLDDKQRVGKALVLSGASISEINAVRKHLSRIKGGRLAAAAFPARTCTLAISDVPGDDPATIASGPTVPDPTTFETAEEVLKRYRIALPDAVCNHLTQALDETPKPGDARLERADFVLLASARNALRAASRIVEDSGLQPILIGEAVEGEARVVAENMAGKVREARTQGGRQVLLSGGELTVTVRGDGRGGPNAEFALALALALEGMADVHAIAGDTDGIDGSGDHAGVVIGPDTLDRARGRGLHAREALQANDAYGFFAALGDLVSTGPTRTNVNDFRAIIVN